MVRRSSTTSRGTTYWFLIFFWFCCIPGISTAHGQIFGTVVDIKCRKGNEANNKLGPRVYAAFHNGGESHYLTEL